MSTPLDPLNPKGTPAAAAGTSGGPGTNPPPEPTVTPEEAGSQALAEALRSSFAIVKIIMVVLVIVFFGSGIFTVSSQERAIVLRFGKPVGLGEQQLLGPGLHWSFPYPIDEVVHIPISQIQTVTSTTGWYSVAPGQADDENDTSVAYSMSPATEGYTLTADGNIIHVRATLRYRINNPLNYTLNFVNASNVLQSALDNALVHASAEFTVDQAVMTAQQEFKERIVANVSKLIDQLGLGITILDSDLRSIPPRQVKTAFNDFIKADVKRRQSISQAEAYASSNRSVAISQAASMVKNSQSERDQLVQAVAAEAKYFSDQLPYYQSNPGMFLGRLQVETITRILTNAENKVLRMDNGDKPMRIQVAPAQQRPPAPQQ